MASSTKKALAAVLAYSLLLSCVAFYALRKTHELGVSMRALAERQPYENGPADYLILRVADRARVFYRGPEEPEVEFYLRAYRDAANVEAGGYLCAVLDGCLSGGFSAELCTYCPEGTDDPACIARHASQKLIFCATFHCTQGCD